MKQNNPPKTFSVFDKYTFGLSLLLASVFIGGVWYLNKLQLIPEEYYAVIKKVIYVDNPSQFSGFVSVIAGLIGFTLPILAKTLWYLILLIIPRPGAGSLKTEKLSKLEESFEVDRAVIRDATVPDHMYSAKPTKSVRKINIGDARLVVPKDQIDVLQNFISKPAKRIVQNKTELRENILIITGEPGAGKSVLIQEIHASLSLGVEQGYHSFIPLFIFARDIKIGDLDESLLEKNPILTFLKTYYEKRSSRYSNLQALIHEFTNSWDKRDLIIIIDGLDEIAQRSVYEEIQLKLAKIITADIGSGVDRVHRYILSCRVDEYLENFQTAENIYLSGLSDKRRETFCKELIKNSSLSNEEKKAVLKLLYSPQLIPSHVFRRNPYFLALLLNHIRNNEQGVREDRKLNFEVLMDHYLLREATRPYASVGKINSFGTEARVDLLNELKKISKVFLQYIAFKTASTDFSRGLYNETVLDSYIIQNFIEQIDLDNSNVSSDNLWTTISKFIKYLSSYSDSGKLLHEIDKLGFTKYFQKYDIVLFKSLADELKKGSPLTEQIVFESFGSISSMNLLEDEQWHRKLAKLLYKQAVGLNLNLPQKLAFLLLARSIAAGHTIRVLLIKIEQEKINFRFRHRRLAEYFGACYLKEKWDNLHETIELSPWLGPILNLACSIESPDCDIFLWLTNKLKEDSDISEYEWRYKIETVVEAAFFAQPGSNYNKGITSIIESIVSALHQVKQKKGKRNIVTETILLGGLEQLANLKDVIGKEIVVNNTVTDLFEEYTSDILPDQIEFSIPAQESIEILSEKKTSFLDSVAQLWKLMQYPSFIKSKFQQKITRKWLFNLTLFLTTLFSQTISVLIIVCIVVGIFNLLAGYLFSSADNIQQSRTYILYLVLALLIGHFVITIWKNPTQAVINAARLWRILNFLEKIVRDAQLFLSIKRFFLRINKLLRLIQQNKWLYINRGIKFLLIYSIVSAVAVFFLNLGIYIPKKIWVSDESKKVENPCKESSDLSAEGINYFVDKIEKASSEEILNIQREVRLKADEIKDKNPKMCGQNEDNEHLLTEDDFLDKLVQHDSRLIPASPAALDIEVDTSEIENLEKIIELSNTSEEVGLLSSVNTINRLNQSKQNLTDIRNLQSKLRKLKRQGIGIPKEAKIDLTNVDSEAEKLRKNGESIKATNSLLQKLELTVEDEQNTIAKQSAQMEYLFIDLIIVLSIFIAAGLVIYIVNTIYNERKYAKIIEKETDIKRLSEFIRHDHLSERIKHNAIRRIYQLENHDEKTLVLIEEVANELLSKFSTTEKRLGYSVAELVATISKRLRYRDLIETSVKN